MNATPWLLLPVLLVSQDEAAPADAGGLESITADEIRAHVVYLASDELEGRKAGTPGSKAAAEYLAKEFASYGLTPIDEGEDWFHSFEARGAPTQNVVGFLQGSDPEFAREVVVIGAHYDHIGKDAETGAIYNGADDDASGTSVMLEVAEAFARAEEKPARSLVFIGFGAEEMGLVGSRHWMEEPLVPVEDTRWMVNLEMMGRGDAGQVTVMRYSHLPERLRDLVAVVAHAEELEVVDGGDAHINAGDQYPFHQAGIPILCFYGGENHPDYHQATDTADKIQPEWMRQVARTVYSSVALIANPARLDDGAGDD